MSSSYLGQHHVTVNVIGEVGEAHPSLLHPRLNARFMVEPSTLVIVGLWIARLNSHVVLFGGEAAGRWSGEAVRR